MDGIANYIEHTNLSPILTIDDVDKLVAEAGKHKFLGVCVPPFWVKRAKREINLNKIILVTVAGFPFGYSMTETKLAEMERAIDNGADEVDVVWNISSFKSGLPWTKIEMAKCSRLAHDSEKIIKIIIETAYLSDNEIIEACKICAEAGADYVKTSTGCAGSGAIASQVALMRRVLPETVGVKASGGIKTYADAISMVKAGAERIGTSSGIEIMEEAFQ